MLTLTVLRCPDAVPPQTRQLSGGELRIGRGADNDWVMPDPERLLSKKHCTIAFRNGGWAILDTSTNGSFLNRESEPLGAGQMRGLRDGDRIRIGAYEIEVRISGASAAGLPPGAPGLDDPFAADPLAPPPPSATPFSHGAFGADDPLFGAAPGPVPVTLPSDYDPLRPAAPDDFLDGPDFGAPPMPGLPPAPLHATQPDHSPAFSDAFVPPRAVPQIPEEDDWDLGFGPAKPLPQAPQPPQAFQPPVAPLPVPPVQVTPVEPGPASPALPLPGAAPLPANPFAEPAPPAPAPAPAPPPAGDAALLAAFLAGAGLEGATPAAPLALMQAVGAALRASVAGIRRALIARASIKGELRIEQTMIRARGNNPLKFSADDDDALSALLGLGRRVDMKPEAAVADALRDMRLHELATMAAMQEAVRALLARFNPAGLRGEADQAGGLSLLPLQKKARAFELFERLHEATTNGLRDDFDAVFGKAFARAYETALRDISARDPAKEG